MKRAGTMEVEVTLDEEVIKHIIKLYLRRIMKGDAGCVLARSVSIEFDEKDIGVTAYCIVDVTGNCDCWPKNG